jgi:CubicO group peptidase (beta-lactamase class C family)
MTAKSRPAPPIFLAFDSTIRDKYRCPLPARSRRRVSPALHPSIAAADDIDDLVRVHLEKSHTPGLAFAVAKGGKLERSGGYGFANLEDQAPVTPQSAFKIASVSKQFLAAAVLALVEDGKLSLDDHVIDHLETAPEAWREITIRHLLAHTSGLVREPPRWDPVWQKPDDWIVRAAFREPLHYPTGTRTEYSNLGYFVIAHIVSRTAHKPWTRYLRERILDRAELTDTRLTSAVDVIPHRAQGYAWRDGKMIHAEEYIAIRPSGALVSTVLDLVKWDEALRTGKVLSLESVREMETPVKLNDGTESNYGLGVELSQIGGRRVVRHSGSLPGFRAELMRVPEIGASIVVLSNGDNADPREIAIAIAKKTLAIESTQKAAR